MFFSFVTARIRRMGKVMFSVCPHLGGGGWSGQSSWGGGQVSPARGGRSGESSRGEGQSSQQGGGGQSSWQVGVRSVQLAGGGGSVQPAGGGSVQLEGGVSILRPLADSMPLAFTQEDFLVANSLN